MKTILITGGLGFIGSHTAVECLDSGYEVILLDNLMNSSLNVISSIETITKRKPIFYQGDVLDDSFLDMVFSHHSIDAVIHFAALKAVNKSVSEPWKYLNNNVSGTMNLLQAMKNHQIQNMVFSSSATVYDIDQTPPFNESMRLGSTHAYGQSKIIVEQMLSLLQQDLHSIALRYFNPVGAHPSGLIGESPLDTPNNLMPLINQVATGQREHIDIYGSDYPTADGTPERDYVHVVDVAKAHILALEKLETFTSFESVNIGTGVPISVIDLIQTYERVNQVSIPHRLAARREGDVATSFASIEKAKTFLSYSPTMSKEEMCKHSYQFMSNQ